MSMIDARREITWKIICHLYRDVEEDALTISSALGYTRSEINSRLYDKREYFSKQESMFSARPLWSLTKDAVSLFESAQNTKVDPKFCPECQSLEPYHTLKCSSFSLNPYERSVPSTVNHGRELGLPGWFATRYSEVDKQIDIDNRRELMLDFLITTFLGNASNKSYVDSYGIPRDVKRLDSLINHLQGINVAASQKIQDLRNNDIVWLRRLDLEKDLP